MLLQNPCPECGTIVDVEPNSSAQCPQCGTSVVGWVKKSSKSEKDALPRHKRNLDALGNGGGSVFAMILIIAGIICGVFFSIWMGLCLAGIGAILAVVSEKQNNSPN
jgi:endogenous inhibitor of DNA gyrase (YacG/DUF329 family)